LQRKNVEIAFNNLKDWKMSWSEKRRPLPDIGLAAATDQR
jgi:hypothetical protein